MKIVKKMNRMKKYKENEEKECGKQARPYNE